MPRDKRSRVVKALWVAPGSDILVDHLELTEREYLSYGFAVCVVFLDGEHRDIIVGYTQQTQNIPAVMTVTTFRELKREEDGVWRSVRPRE